jgi:hypothetical protein
MRASIHQRRIEEAQQILLAMGLPKEQQNERAALSLLALANLSPQKPWHQAEALLQGVTPLMEFIAKHYRKHWKPNTRETVRRFTLHQFEQAGLVIANPDEPTRPRNSPLFCYQIEANVLELLRTYGTLKWEPTLRQYLADSQTLAQRYAQTREMRRIPLALGRGKTIKLSPGGQNTLIKKIVDLFCPRFTPGARPVYVGDTGKKWAFFDEEYMKGLGVSLEEHGKMPDLVIHFTRENWLVLIEAVTSHGPISPKRLAELKVLFADSKPGLVFVTAFLDRHTLLKYIHEIAWETEVWVADAPDHMIHFNGQRFLGPY